MSPVVNYFNGEKWESYLFLLMGIITIFLSIYLVFVLKTSFWKGVAIPFLLVGLLELMVGYTIVNRSPKDIIRVGNFIKNEPQKVRTEEIPRMEKVMDNFNMFRWVEIILIAMGIILMYSTIQDTFWRGLGLGLFIQAGIVLGLDFFAERRGHTYLEFLNDFVGKL
jgi:hypothetical protein